MPLSATLSLTSPKHNTTNHNSISFTLSIPISNPKHSPFNFNPPKPQDDPLITLRSSLPLSLSLSLSLSPSAIQIN
ncbi:unnamed protein product [Malus baccata var. baccata]